MKQLCDLLDHPIRRIELFDNSHIQGSHNVSGMVVYVVGVASKKDYRTYKLGNYVSDLDSMKEVLYRRYSKVVKEDLTPPDLIIVDGGMLQIMAAKAVLMQLNQSYKLCGLVKDDHHKTSQLINEYGEVYDIPRDSALFFLLTQMQDEVHRFAIGFHRKQRSKAMTKSILDEVEGIGEVRKKQIWKQFKSLKNLKAATIEQLSEILPMKVAINLYDLLHETNT